MRIEQSLIDEISKRADIVQIVGAFLPLQKQGKDYLAKCPFHDDNNPSMHVSPEKNMFKCFVCGEGGSAIGFVQKYLHISYPEAVKKVAEMINFTDPRLEGTVTKKVVDEKKVPLLKCLKDLTLYYQYALNTSEGKAGSDYLNSRNLDKTMQDKYKIGYAFKDGKATCDFLLSKGHSYKTMEDVGIASMINGQYVDKNQGRVIFPICDQDGEIIGYSARRINDSDEAKYINSPETYLFHKSDVLYNYHIAKDRARIARCVYVTEGFMDVLALSKVGIDNAVAIMGTALTSKHIEMLRRLNCEIRLCLDGDLPGQTAMMKAAKVLKAANLNFVIIDNQGSSRDPDEILNQDGKETLVAYLNKFLTPNDFVLNYYTRSNPLKTLDQKKQLIKEYLPMLSAMTSQLELDNYLRKLSKITDFDVDSLRDLVKRYKKNETENKINNDAFNTFHPERKILKKLELAEREMLYQMMNHKEALSFYERNNMGFYDKVYRNIAEFLLECARTNEQFDVMSVVASLEASDLDEKDSMIKEIMDLYYERTHPKECSDDLLNGILKAINNEKNDIYEKDTLQASLEGKDPLEQARIYAEYNRRMMQKIDTETKKEK